MIIIHGPNQLKAQEKLDQLLAKAQQPIDKLEAKNLNPALLSQNLSPASLFSTDRLLVIYDLLIDKKLVLHFKKNLPAKNLILYETKTIHPATIKSLNPTQVFYFKEDPLLYKFLETLDLRVLDQIVAAKQPLEMVLFMLARHVRHLIQVKTPGSLKLAPWQLKKLSNQSARFSVDQLINLHKNLYQIDKRQKTSQIKDLKMEIELCILKLTAYETPA